MNANKTISINTIRKIVSDEIKMLQEKLDHEGIRTIIDSSSKLLAALDKFEEDASSPMINSSGSTIRKLRASLEHIVNNPQTYLDRNTKIVVAKKKPTHKLLVKDPTKASEDEEEVETK